MFDDLVYTINGSFFTVYNSLGNVWPEEVYEKALMLELQAQGMTAERQKEFQVYYFDKQVGQYRIDLLVEDKIVIELKAVPEVFPLHKAQLISYLKGYSKPLGILANFGGDSMQYKVFPNKLSQTTVLQDTFDPTNIHKPGEEWLKNILMMANRILVTLGPGYFHQIYRRALYHELQTAGVEFEIAKEVFAEYRRQPIGSREVNFFKIGDLLLSAVAVNELDKLLLLKFRNYIKHLHCRQGLIVNFRALRPIFSYFEL